MNSSSFKSQPLRAYLQLMRPANIITAWADILAGYAASGFVIALAQVQTESSSLIPLGWLLLSTTGLYGGGVVFNDVFDAEIDAQERPERPIPSGRVSRYSGAWLGSLLLVMGVAAAAQVSWLSAILATIIALGALIYDAFSKHHSFWGPLNMGFCRGANLLLGISIVPAILEQRWFLALIPVVYIGAITAISQGEVEGGKRSTGIVAVLLVAVVISAVLTLGFILDYQVLAALPFVVLLAARVLPPFIKGALEPSPELIRNAVKAGVLSLIVLDATVAAGFAGWPYGLIVLSLLPISFGLAQLFAVT